MLLLKVTLLQGCFSRFLYCRNGRKSRNASQMVFMLYLLTSVFRAHFMPPVSFQTPWKHEKTPIVFRGYRKRPMTWVKKMLFFGFLNRMSWQNKEYFASTGTGKGVKIDRLSKVHQIRRRTLHVECISC